MKVQPCSGLTLIWPAEWTHAHKANTLVSGVKYIVTGWMHFLPAVGLAETVVFLQSFYISFLCFLLHRLHLLCAMPRGWPQRVIDCGIVPCPAYAQKHMRSWRPGFEKSATGAEGALSESFRD